MGWEQPSTFETSHPRGDCQFCQRQQLNYILMERSAFFLLADHAPLIEGHILLVPKVHYACYGALAPELEEEFLRVKAEVSEFLSCFYRPPVFWEHGVFHQTVYHAHLHCFPFGSLQLDLSAYHPHPASDLAEVRTWYAHRGQYFYLEQQAGAGQLFAPEEMRYFSVLGALRKEARAHGPWRPVDERKLNGQPKIQSLVQNWRAFAQERYR